MRRTDREVSDFTEILEIIKKCDVCHLALNDAGGFPYIVALNFGVIATDEGLRLVFHSAQEGHKIELMQQDNRAAFQMDCNHTLRYSQENCSCTMMYESVVGKGTVRFLDDEEKEYALQQLMRQYHPECDTNFNPAALRKTAVYCLDVSEFSAKRNIR